MDSSLFPHYLQLRGSWEEVGKEKGVPEGAPGDLESKKRVCCLGRDTWVDLTKDNCKGHSSSAQRVNGS